jgi:hypothetical protein
MMMQIPMGMLMNLFIYFLPLGISESQLDWSSKFWCLYVENNKKRH